VKKIEVSISGVWSHKTAHWIRPCCPRTTIPSQYGASPGALLSLRAGQHSSPHDRYLSRDLW